MVFKEEFSFQPQMDLSIKAYRANRVNTQRVKAAVFTLQLNRNNSFLSILKEKKVES